MEHRPSSSETMSFHEMDVELNNINSFGILSSCGNNTQEVESLVGILTKVELDLACSSEKLVNLDILFIQVASRENDIEAFSLEEEKKSEGSATEALEFDLLCGIFYSEIIEMEGFLFVLQTKIVKIQEILSSFWKPGYAFKGMEQRLKGCEDSMKRCLEQVSEMKIQSSNFQRISVSPSQGVPCKEDNELVDLENDEPAGLNVKIKMQTAEQQRDILRMLERSLAREMDLEKKLSESRRNEEDLQLRMQQEFFCIEIEAEDMLERLFDAENRAEIHLAISKDLFLLIQTVEISMNESTLREGELRSKLEKLSKQLTEKSSALQMSERLRTALLEKVSSLEQKLREYESKSHLLMDSSEQNYGLESKVTEAETRAEIAEAECKLLGESKMELNKDMGLLKSNIAHASNKLEQLERLLKDSEIKSLHASASAEASEEKRNMLECTVKDMEELIEDLKSKVLKAESQVENADAKCIILSESNAKFIKEINILRHRIQHLLTSLHQAHKTKEDTAKDIKVQAKLIADLVMQLTFEREHLYKQISSLTKAKEIPAMYLQQRKNPSVTISRGDNTKAEMEVNSRNPSNEEMMASSTTSSEVGNELGDSFTGATTTGDGDSTYDLNTMRNIDARQLKLKYMITMGVALLLVPALAAYLLHSSE